MWVIEKREKGPAWPLRESRGTGGAVPTPHRQPGLLLLSPHTLEPCCCTTNSLFCLAPRALARRPWAVTNNLLHSSADSGWANLLYQVGPSKNSQIVLISAPLTTFGLRLWLISCFQHTSTWPYTR